MSYGESRAALAAYRGQIAEIREKMRATQAAVEPEPVADYVFSTPEGAVRLTELFGDKTDLIVIHNMGASCPACTLWADGFNGVYPHAADRAAFVVSSPDAPETQRKFAAGRGWRFPMVSHLGTSFAQDMGYRSENGGWRPGVSVFRRTAAGVVRVADTSFGPGDDFSGIWHFWDMLPEGRAGWMPKFSYA